MLRAAELGLLWPWMRTSCARNNRAGAGRWEQSGGQAGTSLWEEGGGVGLYSHFWALPLPQVQNISQSMEVLDLRTYRDLQYVRNTESLMKGLDSRLKVATESQKSLNAKSFQVALGACPKLPPPWCPGAQSGQCLDAWHHCPRGSGAWCKLWGARSSCSTALVSGKGPESPAAVNILVSSRDQCCPVLGTAQTQNKE